MLKNAINGNDLTDGNVIPSLLVSRKQKEINIYTTQKDRETLKSVIIIVERYVIMENEDMLKQQAPSQPIDKTIKEILKQSLEKCLQRHITLLASKKKEVKDIQIKHNMKTPYSEGIIEGLDLAIEQLQTDIKYLKEDK